jgi:aminoglycoside phosphotransferase (APT) family kinase protein
MALYRPRHARRRHRHPALVEFPAGQVAGGKNVIIAPDGTLSGIVDVDDLCYGDPRWVIALTLASLIASGGPQIYTDSWLQRAGLVDDPLFRLYVALFLFDFMSEHGQIFNGNPRESSPEARARLLELFEAAVARAGFT